MPLRIASLLALVSMLLAAALAHADEAAIRKAVTAKFPKAQVQSVTKQPYLGLYEVVIDGEIELA